jgi:hypothetical protein
MARFSATTALALVSLGLIAAPPVTRGETSNTEYSSEDSVPLDENDLRMITLQVLEKHPLLSSSPGIKFAEAHHVFTVTHGQPVASAVQAQVIYYPHVESAGIKQAFQVVCQRTLPEHAWSCPHVEIRRYLRLETQDFEVRVKGDIGHDAALALIQATRGTAQAGTTDGSEVPDTAIMVIPTGNKYLVSWGTDDGLGGVLVEAWLREGGNPAKSEDWRSRILEPQD